MKIHPLQSVWHSCAGEIFPPTSTGVVTRIHTLDRRQPKPLPKRKVTAPRRPPSDDFVAALGHGIALLECWKDAEVWLTNADLAARSGLTRSTASRLASVLVDLGYLHRECQRGRLRLTTATLALGFGSPFASAPVAEMHPALVKLANDLDVYASLGIRRIDKVQVLDNVPSPRHPDAVALDVGGLLPICRSASGLAVLSALSDAEALPLIERMQSRYGGRWQALERQLSRSKQEYASKGYCTIVAELARNVAAVAVPIIRAGSDDIFVLGCGMSATEFYRQRVERDIGPQMLRVAGDLAAALAH